MEETVVYRTLLPVCLTILLTIPSTSSLTSLTSLTTSLTTLTVLTPSVMSGAANFCPVEGTDYIDKPEGNMIKVTILTIAAFSSDNYFDIVPLLCEDKI